MNSRLSTLTQCLDLFIQYYCQTLKHAAPEEQMEVLDDSPIRSGIKAAPSSPQNSVSEFGPLDALVEQPDEQNHAFYLNPLLTHDLKIPT